MSSLYERQFLNKQDKMLISKSQGMFEQSNIIEQNFVQVFEAIYWTQQIFALKFKVNFR